jgi:manganese/zinc/iron transport system permease protein
VSAADWQVMLTAVACAVPCAVLGCFLVLRRMSLLGDAITHAILPGLVMAFAITGTRSPVAMLIGAGVMGLVTAGLSAAINRWGRVDEGAAMGVVFSTLFAVGVVLINVYARNVDLDPGCVLYGVIEYVPLDTREILGLSVPRAMITLGVIGGVALAGVAVFFKELKIVAFDAALATTLGISAAVVHYALLGAVAAVSVASFEAVGSILVVAMLVAPAATAQMLTDRLGRMLWVAAAAAVLDAVAGYWLAVWLNSSVAGMMAAVAGGVFVLTALVAPRYGIAAKAARLLALRLRIAEEDVLGGLYREVEKARGETREARTAARGEGWIARAAAARLVRRGAVEVVGADGSMRLTHRGTEAARSVVRAHRLWESYLAKNTELPLDHLHEPSERVEHFLSGEMQAELEREAGERDPHGKPIPKG